MLRMMTVTQLLKRFPAFCVTSSVITVFTRAHCSPLSWTRLTRSTPSVGRVGSGRVNCCSSSPEEQVLVSGPVGILGHIFVLYKSFAYFEIWPPLRREGGLTTTGHMPFTGDHSSGHTLTSWPFHTHARTHTGSNPRTVFLIYIHYLTTYLPMCTLSSLWPRPSRFSNQNFRTFCIISVSTK
jgi:hypothetical protein